MFQLFHRVYFMKVAIVIIVFVSMFDKTEGKYWNSVNFHFYWKLFHFLMFDATWVLCHSDWFINAQVLQHVRVFLSSTDLKQDFVCSFQSPLQHWMCFLNSFYFQGWIITQCTISASLVWYECVWDIFSH